MKEHYKHAYIFVNKHTDTHSYQNSYMSGHKTMGTRMKEERIAKGWSQTNLAKQAGVTQPTISTLERDEGESRKIAQIAYAMNLSPRWLIEGKGEKYVASPATGQTDSGHQSVLSYDAQQPREGEEMRFVQELMKDGFTMLEQWVMLGEDDRKAVNDDIARRLFFLQARSGKAAPDPKSPAKSGQRESTP